MYDLKREIMTDLTDLFKDQNYKAPDKEDGRTIHIFRNFPPLHDDASKDVDDFDYIAVYVSEGSRDTAESTEKMTAHLVVGVYDDAQDWSGADTLDLIIERVLNHYDEHPLLNHQFKCSYPRNYVLKVDDEVFPYFFAVISLTFERVTMTEEDPYV